MANRSLDTPLPIIRLEVSAMKYQLQTVLHEFSAQMDTDLQNAVDKFCTPENITKIIEEEAERLFNSILREEMTNWFRYGGGQKAIREAIEEKLGKNQTYTPLDEKDDNANVHPMDS